MAKLKIARLQINLQDFESGSFCLSMTPSRIRDFSV